MKVVIRALASTGETIPTSYTSLMNFQSRLTREKARTPKPVIRYGKSASDDLDVGCISNVQPPAEMIASTSATVNALPATLGLKDSALPQLSLDGSTLNVAESFGQLSPKDIKTLFE